MITLAPGTKRGVVYIEVLLSLMPVLLIFLGVCQYSLLYMAKLVVQHAATRAARAAMVILEDHPALYDDAERGDLLSGEADSNQGVQTDLEAKFDTNSISDFEGSETDAETSNAGSESNQSSEDIEAGARWAAIRAAAYHPLSVLAPSPLFAFEPTLSEEIAEGALTRILFGRFFYNSGAAAITLHHPGSDEVLTQVGKHDPITVRVAFLMPCGIPLVSALMCQGRADRLLADTGLGDNKAGQEMLDKTEFVESKNARTIILAGVPHLTLLTAEATMPNQGASYYD